MTTVTSIKQDLDQLQQMEKDTKISTAIEQSQLEKNEIEYPTWIEQWQVAFNEQLDDILNDDEMSAEEIKAHVLMLNYVDRNIEIIFEEIAKVQRILCYGKESIMFHGFKTFVEGFEYEWPKDYFKRAINEHIDIRFEPFVFEEFMFVECNIVYKGAYLAIVIKELEPELLEFRIE